MLDLSPEKIFVLAVVAMVVLGPQRLPQAARTLGRLVGQLRSLTNSVQDEVRDALHEPQQAFGAALSDFRPAEIRRNVRQTVIDTISPAAGPPPLKPTPDRSSSPAAGAPPWASHPDDPTLN